MNVQLRVMIQCLVVFLFALTITACDGDEDNSNPEVSTDDQNVDNTEPDAGSVDDPEPEDTGTDLGTEFTVNGIVKRRATAAVKEDGIGTLCVAITHSCPGQNNSEPQMLGEGLVVKDADFSANGAEVPFTITVNMDEAEIDKAYFVSAVMKENGGECVQVPGEPVLLAGDMVGMTCGRFVFKGTNIENLKVFLDWTLEQDY